jgi:hypothetical protein
MTLINVIKASPYLNPHATSKNQHHRFCFAPWDEHFGPGQGDVEINTKLAYITQQGCLYACG